ncbi:MAG: AIM24 family protein, partial [Thermoplasmata archaeon]|nr:AIM24 family protein [Thermoplasmata archaeon]
FAGGDPLFLLTFTALENNQKVSFADNTCGNILALRIDKDHSYLCDRSAYLCSEPTVDLDVAFMKKIRMGLFGGEGFILERLSGEGWVFLHGWGELQKRVLSDGEQLKVMSSKVMAISTTISMDVEFIKSANSILFSGRGLFTTCLKGVGDVYLQSFSKHQKVGV